MFTIFVSNIVWNKILKNAQQLHPWKHKLGIPQAVGLTLVLHLTHLLLPWATWLTKNSNYTGNLNKFLQLSPIMLFLAWFRQKQKSLICAIPSWKAILKMTQRVNILLRLTKNEKLWGIQLNTAQHQTIQVKK